MRFQQFGIYFGITGIKIPNCWNLVNFSFLTSESDLGLQFEWEKCPVWAERPNTAWIVNDVMSIVLTLFFSVWKYLEFSPLLQAEQVECMLTLFLAASTKRLSAC